jgi:hypothetical protein
MDGSVLNGSFDPAEDTSGLLEDGTVELEGVGAMVDKDCVSD